MKADIVQRKYKIRHGLHGFTRSLGSVYTLFIRAIRVIRASINVF